MQLELPEARRAPRQVPGLGARELAAARALRVQMSDDARDAQARALADFECELCGGTGEAMEMVCYGGLPQERWSECPDCDGTGELQPLDGFPLIVLEQQET